MSLTSEERVAELRRRVIEVAGLVRPQPYVSTDVALLLADLVSAVEQASDQADELAHCLGVWEEAVGEINTWPSRCRQAMASYRAWAEAA